MAFNLNSLIAFYQNDSNPQEFVRRQTEDPIGKIVAAYLTAEQSYKDAMAEYKALGITSEISIDPTRSTELEGIMTTALVTRATMLAGLEAAVVVLGDEEGPTTRYFEVRKRGRDSVEVARIQGIIDALEAIAVDAFA